MSLTQLKNQIKELKKSLIQETKYIILFFDQEGNTTLGMTLKEADEYEKTHPYTKVIRFPVADFS